MVKRQFQNGDVLFADDVNAIANPIVDGGDYIGHGPKVIDDYLSDDPTQIKGNFYNFYNRLRVSVQSGLTLNYLSGALLLSNGSLVSISPGTISVPDNTFNYIFVNSSGSVQSSTVLPNECFPLASAATSGGSVTTLTDLRNKIIDRVSPSTIPVQQLIPTGTGMEFWGTVLPTGWLWADGSTYLITQYPALFAAIGYIHGGSGNQFKVPDKRGRVGVGAGQGTSGLTNRTIGQTFGSETVTLNVSQMPLHTHGINDPGHTHGIADPGHAHGISDPGHIHALFAITSDPPYVSSQTDGFLAKPFVAVAGEDAADKGYLTINASGNALVANNGSNIGIYGAGTNISIYGAGTNISVNSQGGNGAHDNIQPSIVCNYIIKI